MVDLDLAVQVRDKLIETRRDLRNVAVLVDDGKVRLRGAVPTFHLRQLAVDRARCIPGVKYVIDEMSVGDA